MSRSGRRTLKALRAFTSNPSICKLAKIELTTLKKGKKKNYYTAVKLASIRHFARTNNRKSKPVLCAVEAYL